MSEDDQEQITKAGQRKLIGNSKVSWVETPNPMRIHPTRRADPNHDNLFAAYLTAKRVERAPLSFLFTLKALHCSTADIAGSLYGVSAIFHRHLLWILYL